MRRSPTSTGASSKIACSRSTTPPRRCTTSRCGRRYSATPASFAPLSSENRVDRLALPLALDPLVLDQVRLLAHPEPLEHGRGARVARLEPADHAVQIVGLERKLEHRLGRLGRVAVALV